jgi:predicted GNAT family acetyltransferase
MIKQDDRYFYIGEADKKQAYMRYKVKDNLMTIIGTRVDPSLRNQGLAGQLLEHVVNYAIEHGLKIIPECSYVKHKFETSHAYDDVWYKD